MGVWELIGISLVALFALYGCSQAMIKLAMRLIRPTKPLVSLTLMLEHNTAVEQQLRYALLLAKEWKIPLCTTCNELDADETVIVNTVFSRKLECGSCT